MEKQYCDKINSFLKVVAKKYYWDIVLNTRNKEDIILDLQTWVLVNDPSKDILDIYNRSEIEDREDFNLIFQLFWPFLITKKNNYAQKRNSRTTYWDNW